MSKNEGRSDRSRGNLREASYIFIATIVVLILVIAAFNIFPLGRGGTSFEITNDQYIDYEISGKLGNVSVGGEIRLFFMESGDHAPSSFNVTLSVRTPWDATAPFVDKPLLVSRHFDYDGANLTCLGDLLIYGLPLYVGSNASGLSYGTFGELVDHHVVQTSIGNGEAGHYIKSANGTSLEQWILDGTGLPVKLKYADAEGTDLTLTGWESNVSWINGLNR